MTTTTLPFAIGTSRSGIPLTTAANTALQQGMQGGSGTQAFMAGQIVQDNFFGYLNENNDSCWSWSVDESGNPAYFAAQQSGSNTMFLAGTATIDAGAAANPGSSGQFTFNEQTYNIIGTLTTTLGYNTAPLWYMQVPLGVADGITSGVLAKILWSSALKPIMTGVWNGLKSCITKCSSAEDPGDVADAADDAAEDASFEGAEGGADISIDFCAAAASYMGLSIVVALPILVMALAHNTFSHIQVYNLTSYDVVWSLAYQDSGQMYIEPTTLSNNGTTEYTIPATGSYSPEPGIIAPVTVVHEADFGYTNTNQFEGFGYVMQFALNEAGTTTNVDTATVMISVPWDLTNTLATATGTLPSVANWYKENVGAGTNEVTQSVAQDSNVVVTATFDYLSGQHPAGSQGQDQFYYQSIIVLSPPPVA
jgi:hypothetical protein